MGQDKMKNKWVMGLTLWAIAFLTLYCFPVQGQTTPPSLTILYSNNMNGEIDPCPV